MQLTRDPETLSTAADFKAEMIRVLRGPGVFAASEPTFRDAVEYGVVGRESNIVGIGFGLRFTKETLSSGARERASSERALLIYVRKKLPKSQLTSRETIPNVVNGQPTDVIEVGEIQAGSARRTLNPIECGVSGAHESVHRGTIGCIVTIAGKTGRFFLSCNHVFADANRAALGDPILQASPGDGGTLPDVASLEDFEPLVFTRGAINEIDAAIAKIITARSVSAAIMRIGSVAGTVSAVAPSNVQKHGRTTEHTLGELFDISADISVNYGIQKADFEDQLAIRGTVTTANPLGAFGASGDSGALILDDARQAVGLLFAVASEGGLVYANPIGGVLKRFSATIV